MDAAAPVEQRWTRMRFITMGAVLIGLYIWFYLVLCGLPLIGEPTFRIDHYATTLTRGDELSDFITAISHSRPVSALYASAQGAFAGMFLDGHAEYIAYPLQHAALIVYFLLMARTFESVLNVRFDALPLIGSWAVFVISPSVLEGVYKLETIVGSLSMLFGALAMWAIVRWRESGNKRFIAGFLLAYALSVLAKEDFAVPPLLLLAYYATQGGFSKARLSSYRAPFIALCLLAAFFFTFNHYLIEDRAFITSVPDPRSPYFITFSPTSMVMMAQRYIFDLDPAILTMAAIFAALCIVSIAKRTATREVTFLVLGVGGLMAPYLIMPNHVYIYYAQKWFVWLILGSLALAYRTIPYRRQVGVVWVIVCVAVVAPSIIGVTDQSGKLWHQSSYFNRNFQISRNIESSLDRYRPQLNLHERVAVLGIGPGQIEHTPWQGNGETSFILEGDYSLTPAWTVYVRENGRGYRATQAPGNEKVRVALLENLSEAEGMPVLRFDEDGVATFHRLGKEEISKFSALYEGVVQPVADVTRQGKGRVWAEPSSIPLCRASERKRVRINWDFSQAAASQSVDIWIRPAGQGKKLWTTTGVRGSAESGPWASPGLEFIFEEHRTASLLGRVVIGGERCP